MGWGFCALGEDAVAVERRWIRWRGHWRTMSYVNGPDLEDVDTSFHLDYYVLLEHRVEKDQNVVLGSSTPSKARGSVSQTVMAQAGFLCRL